MTIRARYSGLCPECGGRWEPGDAIDTVEPGNLSRWVHAVCPDDDTSDPTVLKPHEIVCPDCFLIHPRGVCDR